MTLSNDVRLVDIVHQTCEELGALAGWDGDERLELALAAREAVVNAMIHGNGESSEEPVGVTFTVEGDSIELLVRDQGRGFDPEEVPDPTNDENLLKTSGRGLKMIRKLMDQVSYSFPEEGGTVLTMSKRRTKKAG